MENDPLKIEIDIHFLYPGMMLKGDGYDESGRKVIDKLTPITQEQIDRLFAENVITITYTRERLKSKKEHPSNMISEEHFERAIEVVADIEFAIRTNRARLPFKGVEQIIDNFINDIRNNREACLNLLDLSDYDDYTYSHSVNVAILCIFLGFSMTMDEKSIREMGIAALMHDIGKVLVSVDIIRKPGPLTDEEWDIIRRHPVYGYHILLPDEHYSKETVRAVLFHHENFQGGGYPYGVTGDKTNLYAHCISVADTFDAMTSDKPYRAAKSYNEAFHLILDESGKKFDPKVAQAFLKEMLAKTNEEPLYPVGAFVLLSTGEVARVTGYRQSPYTLRPIVNIFFNPDKDEKFLKYMQQVDLEQDYTRNIIRIITEPHFIEKFKLYFDE